MPGPLCALYPGGDDQAGKSELTLWVKTRPGTQVEIRADSIPVTELEREELEDGRLYELQFPQTASRLTVRFARSDGIRGPSWVLRLSPPEKPVWIDELVELINGGRTDEARKRLLRLRREAPPKEQGLVLTQLALIARQEGRYDEAIAHFRAGIAADHAVRRVSDLAQKSTTLAWIYLQQGRFRDAQQVLALDLPPGTPANAKYWVFYYKGLLAQRLGDYRSALDHLHQAIDLAKRVEIKGRGDAEQVLADLLQQLGRSRESSEALEMMLNAPQLKRCEHGDLLTNWGWARLLAREAGEAAADPTARLREALTLFEHPCARKDQRLNARLNLALAHWQEERWSDARAMLAEAAELRRGGAEPTLLQILWWEDLAARLEIAEGHPQEAVRLFEELDRISEQALALEGRARASRGLAHAWRALGEPGQALAALDRAENLIDQQLAQIPVQEGRDTFLAQQDAITRLHLEILLERRPLAEAFDLVRRARSRLLRQLAVGERLSRLNPEEQRQWDQKLADYRRERDAIDHQAAGEWKLSQQEEERERAARKARLQQILADLDRVLAGLEDPGDGSLAPPRPGEVILTYYPLSSGWIGFAAYGSEIEVSRPFALPDDPAALASTLLGPFHSMIERAKQVRVLPYGPLRKVDFHVLPFKGRPLLAGRPVVYGLDVPVRSAAPALISRRALLVADPTGTLPAARQEAEEISDQIASWGPAWTLEKLETTEALAERVRQLLPGAELFHFAGHGTFDGFGAWESSLVLADGSSLTLGDLLALRPMPAWVMLSACDAGRSSLEAPGEGLGLAHAFILAGARGVIAATRPVPDQTGRALMRELYGRWRPGQDLAAALQRAQLACLDERHPDCASFRLLEP